MISPAPHFFVTYLLLSDKIGIQGNFLHGRFSGSISIHIHERGIFKKYS